MGAPVRLDEKLKSHYQLVIIGAGPAGSYAALTAARGGLEVLLVERDSQVGLPLACAEAISRNGLTRFVEPQSLFISTEIDTIAFTVATGYQFSYRLPQPVGYVLDRPVFDRWLAEKAVEHGAELRTGAYASGVNISDGDRAQITLETVAGVTTVEADWVIGADGVESMIGRMAGIRTILKLSQNETSLQYRVSGISLDPLCLEFCVGSKFSPDGYLWVFPKSEHSANIGVGMNPAKNDNRDLRRYLDDFLRERYGQYTVDFESGGLVPKFLGLNILGRDNLLLAGDAARTIDSLTGAGIARALHTGQMAAQIVIEGAAGNIPRNKIVARYKSMVEKEIGGDLYFFKKAHTIFRKFNDRDWESLARFLRKYLAKQKAGSIDPAAMVKSALTGAPRLIRLARHMF